MLYVDEGQVITSAGSAAGLDACLHLIRRDYGAAVANTVARRMVVAPHREGGQAQYVEAPVVERTRRGVGPAMDWARAHLHEPLVINDLASRAAMSPRTFLRRFTEAAGTPPYTWLQQQRIGRARQLLETKASMTLDDVAAQCGLRITRDVSRRVQARGGCGAGGLPGEVRLAEGGVRLMRHECRVGHSTPFLAREFQLRLEVGFVQPLEGAEVGFAQRAAFEGTKQQRAVALRRVLR